jgi:hypothetical protein
MGTVATAVPQKRSFLSRFRLQHALSGLLTWYRSFSRSLIAEVLCLSAGNIT